MKLSDKQRNAIIAWLESMPWWEELPYKVLENVADAANDLWALFSHNPDEIPYGDAYEEETKRLHRELGQKLRDYTAKVEEK